MRRRRIRNGAGTVLALLALLSGLAAFAAEDTERVTVEIRTRHGETVTLREVGFGAFVPARPGPPADHRPPGMEPGDLPGTVGEKFPGLGPNAGGGREGRVRAQFGSGLETDQGLGKFRGRIRRIVVLSAGDVGVVVDLTLVNGKTLEQRRMSWTQVYGWDRPGQRGTFHILDAADIDTIDFVSY